MAHKKGQGSSRNGRDSNPHGIARCRGVWIRYSYSHRPWMCDDA